MPVHEITVNISDIVNLVYSVGFIITAVYLSYLRQITMAGKILYILERFRISEVVYRTDVLWRGKFCIYYSGSEFLKSYIRQLYYGGENFVSTTEVQNSPPSKLRQLHYVGDI